MVTGDLILAPKHPWLPIAESPNTLGRTLTRAEQLFCKFNNVFYGQNSPWIGASISISIQNVTGHSHPHNLIEQDLLEVAMKSWVHTRWQYPMIACQVEDAEKMLYRVENEEEVKEWAGRTVRVLRQEGGWPALRDRLSEMADLPTGDGDCCLLYVVVDPSDSDSVAAMEKFDVLIHFHHALTDGTGMRTILNEVLMQMAKIADKEREKTRMMWGGEVERLCPAVLDLATERERGAFEDRREDAIPSGPILPTRQNPARKTSKGAKGSRISTHSFSNPSFLPTLLSLCRNNKIKLTALMQATLVAALYEFSPTKPRAEENFILPSAIDLRNGRIIPPYTDRNVYVFNSTVVELIKGSWDLFQGEESRNERVLKIARHFATQWAELAFGTVIANSDDTVREMGQMMLEMAEGVTEEIPSVTIHDLYFVADPPGSNQLSSRYEIAGGGHFVLEHYQISTSQNTSKVSCRFHSWKERLTLCLVYNSVGRSKATMVALLAKWIELIESVAASSPEGLGMNEHARPSNALLP